jgi:hypothetical protein
MGRTWVLAIVILLGATTLAAQQRQSRPTLPPAATAPPVLLPYPNLPQQPAGGLTGTFPFMPPRSIPPRDLYRVGPFDRVYTSTRSRYPIGSGYYGGGYYDSGYYDSNIPQLEPQAAQQPIVIVVPQAAAPSPEASTEPPANLPPPVRPTGPKTLYVIPNCYAGNVRPRADRLPSGCDLRKLVKID